MLINKKKKSVTLVPADYIYSFFFNEDVIILMIFFYFYLFFSLLKNKNPPWTWKFPGSDEMPSKHPL